MLITTENEGHATVKKSNLGFSTALAWRYCITKWVAGLFSAKDFNFNLTSKTSWKKWRRVAILETECNTLHNFSYPKKSESYTEKFKIKPMRQCLRM